MSNELAKNLVIPSPFGEGFRCENCASYLTVKEADVATVFTPQGPQQMPLEHAVKQGLPIGAYVSAKMAPCTFHPIWHLVFRTHWCQQFETAKRADLNN